MIPVGKIGIKEGKEKKKPRLPTSVCSKENQVYIVL